MLYFAPGKTNVDYPQGRNSLTTLEEQIATFHDMYKVWILNIAEQVAQIPDAGFAVLAILNPYFEMIARYDTGTTSRQARGQSTDLIKYGLALVYPELKAEPVLSEIVYHHLADALRHSMAHIGLTGSKINLHNGCNYPMLIHANKTEDAVELLMITINTTLWVQRIQAHFEAFIARLRDPENYEARRAFSVVFLEKL